MSANPAVPKMVPIAVRAGTPVATATPWARAVRAWGAGSCRKWNENPTNWDSMRCDWTHEPTSSRREACTRRSVSSRPKRAIRTHTRTTGSAKNCGEVVTGADSMAGPGLVPELLVTSLEASLDFWFPRRSAAADQRQLAAPVPAGVREARTVSPHLQRVLCPPRSRLNGRRSA